jgi:hypothetical protein
MPWHLQKRGFATKLRRTEALFFCKEIGILLDTHAMAINKKKLETAFRVLGVPDGDLDNFLKWEEEGDAILAVGALVKVLWAQADKTEAESERLLKRIGVRYGLPRGVTADIRALMRRVIREVVIGIAFDLNVYPDIPDLPDEVLECIRGWILVEVDNSDEAHRQMDFLRRRVVEFADQRWASEEAARFRIRAFEEE